MVRDQAHLLRPWLRFHALQGVRHVHIYDHRSRDGDALAAAAVGYADVSALRARALRAHCRLALRRRSASDGVECAGCCARVKVACAPSCSSGDGVAGRGACELRDARAQPQRRRAGDGFTVGMG